jgi:hypothetical protein
MPSANVGLVRSIYKAWEYGDWLSVEWAHPELRYAYADGPSPGEWRGIEGMTEGFRDFLCAWEDWGVVADGYMDLDGERVLVSFHFTGRGKASGLDVTQLQAEGATLFELSGDKVIRIVQYLDRDRALLALGLTPEAG